VGDTRWQGSLRWAVFSAQRILADAVSQTGSGRKERGKKKRRVEGVDVAGHRAGDVAIHVEKRAVL